MENCFEICNINILKRNDLFGVRLQDLGFIKFDEENKILKSEKMNCKMLNVKEELFLLLKYLGNGLCQEYYTDSIIYIDGIDGYSLEEKSGKDIDTFVSYYNKVGKDFLTIQINPETEKYIYAYNESFKRTFIKQANSGVSVDNIESTIKKIREDSTKEYEKTRNYVEQEISKIESQSIIEKRISNFLKKTVNLSDVKTDCYIVTKFVEDSIFDNLEQADVQKMPIGGLYVIDARDLCYAKIQELNNYSAYNKNIGFYMFIDSLVYCDQLRNKMLLIKYLGNGVFQEYYTGLLIQYCEFKDDVQKTDTDLESFEKDYNQFKDYPFSILKNETILYDINDGDVLDLLAKQLRDKEISEIVKNTIISINDEAKSSLMIEYDRYRKKYYDASFFENVLYDFKKQENPIRKGLKIGFSGKNNEKDVDNS